MSPKVTRKRKPGRPKKSQAPNIDWNEVDRVLVHGDGEGNYPTYAELGKKYGVHKSRIGRFSQKHNCLDRRKNVDKQLQEYRESISPENTILDLFGNSVEFVPIGDPRRHKIKGLNGKSKRGNSKKALEHETEFPPDDPYEEFRNQVLESQKKKNGALPRNLSLRLAANVEELYLKGERVMTERGTLHTTWPSTNDIGKRLGVAGNSVGHIVSRRRLDERRKELQDLQDAKIVEALARKESEARAASIARRREIIDLFVEHFHKAVEEEKVKADPCDFDRLVRLDYFLAGEADSRVEHTGVITLQALQARFIEVKDRVIDIDPALTGEADNEKRRALEAEEETIDVDEIVAEAEVAEMDNPEMDIAIG